MDSGLRFWFLVGAKVPNQSRNLRGATDHTRTIDLNSRIWEAHDGNKGAGYDYREDIPLVEVTRRNTLANSKRSGVGVS